MLHKDEIQIRDPFILPGARERLYYLYGTTDRDPWHEGCGFNAYTSADLALWEGPYNAFTPPAGFWADRNFWAPEVFLYRDAYYMFASFKSPVHARGTQILCAASPLGPFLPITGSAVTPGDWECLDGTLFIDDDEEPWIVFCHEWQQIRDGSICAQRLSRDLKSAQGAVFTLFSASQAPWTSPYRGNNYVTDGPCLHRAEDGILVILWSSFRNDRYAIGLVRSASGRITGPWIHNNGILFPEEGGHCMLFRDFNNRTFITYHSPNQTPLERMVLKEIPAVTALIE